MGPMLLTRLDRRAVVEIVAGIVVAFFLMWLVDVLLGLEGWGLYLILLPHTLWMIRVFDRLNARTHARESSQ